MEACDPQSLNLEPGPLQKTPAQACTEPSKGNFQRQLPKARCEEEKGEATLDQRYRKDRTSKGSKSGSCWVWRRANH